MLLIIFVLLVIYLILIHHKPMEKYENLSVEYRYTHILTAIDEARDIFDEVMDSKNKRNININILRQKLIKGFSTSNVGRIRQFCSFPEGMYSYFFLYLFYSEYKKNKSGDISNYIENLSTKCNNIDKIITTRINNTLKSMNQIPDKEYKDYKFYPSYLGEEKVKKDIENSRKIFIDKLSKSFQNSISNPKSIIVFNKKSVNVKKEEQTNIYRYLLTHKIALQQGKSGSPLLWKDIKGKYCAAIQKNPENVFTYELSIELIKKEEQLYCQSIKVQNICMLSLRSCFKELKETSEFNYTPVNTGREVKVGRARGLDIRKASIFTSKEEQLRDFSKKLRERVELYGSSGKAGSCFDKQNNLLLDVIRKEDCPKDYSWSYPCTRDRECAYYKRNKNYKNEYGKCVNNYCEIPLGVKSIGYNTKSSVLRKDNINDALCYNCSTPDARCCADQLRNNKDPDYAFKNDYMTRLENREDLEKRGLQVKNDTIDIKDLLKFTNFN